MVKMNSENLFITKFKLLISVHLILGNLLVILLSFFPFSLFSLTIFLILFIFYAINLLKLLIDFNVRLIEILLLTFFFTIRKPAISSSSPFIYALFGLTETIGLPGEHVYSYSAYDLFLIPLFTIILLGRSLFIIFKKNNFTLPVFKEAPFYYYTRILVIAGILSFAYSLIHYYYYPKNYYTIVFAGTCKIMLLPLIYYASRNITKEKIFRVIDIFADCMLLFIVLELSLISFFPTLKHLAWEEVVNGYRSVIFGQTIFVSFFLIFTFFSFFRRFLQKKSIKYILFILFILFASFLTTDRICLLVELLIVALYFFIKGNILQRTFIAIIFFIGIVFYTSLISLIGQFAGNYKYDDFGGIGSLIDRFALQLRGIDLFLQNPLWGYGVNSMQPLSVSEKLPWILTNYFDFGEQFSYFINLIMTSGHVSNTHNLYIENLFNLGILGSIFFYLWFIYPLKMLFKFKSNELFFLVVLVVGFSFYYMFQAMPDEAYIIFAFICVIQNETNKNISTIGI